VKGRYVMAIEIELAPESETFDPGDDRWLTQVAGLYDDLRNEGIALREESTPVPGAKGDLPTIIAALGSAGAFTAAITVIQAWLSRERTRHLKLRVKVGDTSTEIDIDADTDNATLERLAQAAMKQAAGA
jgi:hypothetical protein